MKETPKVGEEVRFMKHPDESIVGIDRDQMILAKITHVHYVREDFASVNIEFNDAAGSPQERHSIRYLSKASDGENRPYAVPAWSSQSEAAETIQRQTPQEAHEAYAGPDRESVAGPVVGGDSAESDETPVAGEAEATAAAGELNAGASTAQSSEESENADPSPESGGQDSDASDTASGESTKEPAATSPE